MLTNDKCKKTLKRTPTTFASFVMQFCQSRASELRRVRGNEARGEKPLGNLKHVCNCSALIRTFYVGVAPIAVMYV